MKRTIEFDDNELTEFIAVMKLCQPLYGLTGASMGKVISAYFNKKYKAEVKYVECGPHRKLPSNRESKVEINPHHWIPFDHIIDELIDRNLVEKSQIHVEDAYGNLVYRDEKRCVPHMMRVYKAL